MQVNKYIFRGYDIRGLADIDLNPEIVEHLGKAYGTYMLKAGGTTKIIVGHDVRLTSETYSDALIKGILSTGLDVIDIGLTMVGTLYWAQYYFQTKGSVMVTASHNPGNYNGFKLCVDYSETMVSESLVELRNRIENEDYIVAEKPGTVEKFDILPVYLQMLHEKFQFKKTLKVLVDPSHATPGAIVPGVLRDFGFEVIEKHCNLDGNFPLGTADPTEKEVATRLAKEVVENGADIGFTYDADGDRIGIVDEKGGIIWNDVLVALLANDVLKHHPGEKIMFNMLCSKVVTDTINKNGGIPFMWRTGHSFLKKKNQEVKAAFIGELSGHFFFSKDFYNHDDGIYTTLRLLDFLTTSNISLSDAISTLPKYVSSPEIKVGCPDDAKVALIEKMSLQLQSENPKAEIISDERAGDGVRLDYKDAMFVVRYSQNGPYLTIKYEATNQDRYQELKQYIYNFLKQYPEIIWSDGVNTDSLTD